MADRNPFEFVRLASLRAAQLMRGCTPRVPARARPVLTARAEVTAGKVVALPREILEEPMALSKRELVVVPPTRR